MLNHIKLFSIITLLLVLTISPLSFAKAKYRTCSTTKKNFCACFKSEVKGACLDNGVNSTLCSSMRLVYYGMMARYGSLYRACKQNNQTKADIDYCLNGWSCYMKNHYYNSHQDCPYRC